jgi:hypothetical protein
MMSRLFTLESIGTDGTVQVIARVRYFGPSGWYSYPPRARLVFQITCDPGFTGQSVEIQVSEPTVSLQLPVTFLSEAVTHFPAPPPAAYAGTAS